MIQPQVVDNTALMLTDEELQKIREERNKKRVPQSLMELAMKAVGKHCTRFIDNPDSSLKNLPNTVVQKFLTRIASSLDQFNIDEDPEKLLIPLPHLSEVLIQLMNPCVTEINCSVFDRAFKGQEYNNILLEQALKNCPKISKVQMNTKLIAWYPMQGFHMPVEQFKKSWNDLKSIVIQNKYFYDGDTLKLIQQNYPNIEELSISFMTLSLAGAEHLKKMKKLHTLNIFEMIIIMDPKTHDENMIAVAGEVPSLRNFNFNAALNHTNFINGFALKYPWKELLVKHVKIESGLTEKWPKNLYVSRLEIIGALSQRDIENLSTIACELELNMNSVDAVHMYKLLERIGHLVKSLGIGDTSQSRDEQDGRPIDLERILPLCPNLEQFDYNTHRKVVQDRNCNLQPAAFKNYRSFSIHEDIIAVNDESCKVFKNFLIGTEVCEELELKDYKQLQMLAEVALTHPKSLQKLREVKNGPYVHLSITQVFNPAERRNIWNRFCKSILQVLTCCPSLEKVIIAGGRNIVQENRNFATIKAIGPNIIEFQANGVSGEDNENCRSNGMMMLGRILECIECHCKSRVAPRPQRTIFQGCQLDLPCHLGLFN